MSRRVWIVQCLCGPERHCIAALAEECTAGEVRAVLEQPLREKIRRLLEAGALNPWCGLCGAPAAGWRYEPGRTRFRTMGEAEPRLRELEAEQGAVRAVFGDMDRSKPN